MPVSYTHLGRLFRYFLFDRIFVGTGSRVKSEFLANQAVEAVADEAISKLGQKLSLIHI